MNISLDISKMNISLDISKMNILLDILLILQLSYGE